jgi:hypothetical protein
MPYVRLQGVQEELEEAKLEYAQLQVLCDDCMRLIQQQQERHKELTETINNIGPGPMVQLVVDDMTKISASMVKDVSKSI